MDLPLSLLFSTTSPPKTTVKKYIGSLCSEIGHFFSLIFPFFIFFLLPRSKEAERSRERLFIDYLSSKSRIFTILSALIVLDAPHCELTIMREKLIIDMALLECLKLKLFKLIAFVSK